VQAEKTSSENPAIEISPQLALNEPGNGCALPTCVGEETLESVAHYLVEERLLRLVALVIGHAGPVRDRVYT
jgi:hypothetical protein